MGGRRGGERGKSDGDDGMRFVKVFYKGFFVKVFLCRVGYRYRYPVIYVTLL